ncbi:MAG: universal stress protein [Desulforegulaceae bacterium]|nr:universal stress protein [Desulforegulaceae bacterium]
MNPFKKILYVSENSVNQTSTLERTVSIAQKNRAELVVADIVPQTGDAYFSKIKDYHTQKLEELIRPFQNRIKIQTKILTGRVFIEVIRQVIKNRFDLVVKPAENSNFKIRLFGSVDMHLLRKCPCPLWIMKTPEKPGCQNIIAAVDFDPLRIVPPDHEFNNEILDLAAAIAKSDKASLHIVHAWDTFAEKAVLSYGDMDDKYVDNHIEKQHLVHQKELYSLGLDLQKRISSKVYADISPSFHLPKGMAKKVIPKIAKKLQTDLVVMGTVARTGIAGLIIGNAAEAILEQLSCSVLAIKPPGFETPVKLDF